MEPVRLLENLVMALTFAPVLRQRQVKTAKQVSAEMNSAKSTLLAVNILTGDICANKFPFVSPTR